VVAEIAYRGEQSVYLVRLSTGRQVRVTQPNLRRQGSGERIRWDEAVWLSWNSSSPVVVTQ
jgi:putrescine transport system ATP-binding protein